MARLTHPHAVLVHDARIAVAFAEPYRNRIADRIAVRLAFGECECVCATV